MKNKQKQQGMTLLEVLVAMVIFALGCLTIVQTMSQQITGFSNMEKKVIASWVADNQLSLLTLSQQKPQALWSMGAQEMVGQTWYWRYRSRQTTDLAIKAIEIEISEQPTFDSILLQVKTWTN